MPDYRESDCNVKIPLSDIDWESGIDAKTANRMTAQGVGFPEAHTDEEAFWTKHETDDETEAPFFCKE